MMLYIRYFLYVNRVYLHGGTLMKLIVNNIWSPHKYSVMPHNIYVYLPKLVLL